MFGLYLVIGVLIAVILILAYVAVAPKLKQYRFTVKKIEPKKRRAKPMKKNKKKKSVWIRVL